jgi:hypothetical protein
VLCLGQSLQQRAVLVVKPQIHGHDSMEAKWYHVECRVWLRRTAPGLASANRREGAHRGAPGAGGSARPVAPRILGALRAQQRRHDGSGIPGVSRTRQKRKGLSRSRLATCPSAGTTRPSVLAG